MESIIPSVQDTTPSAPAFSLGTLRAVLAKGQAAHPDLAPRMDKAAHILATRDVTPTGDDGHSWWVASETQADQWYMVVRTPRGAWPCTCRDFERRHDWCKHGLSVALLLRCSEREQGRGPEEPPPLPPPVVLPFPACNPNAPIPYALTDKALAALAGAA